MSTPSPIPIFILHADDDQSPSGARNREIREELIWLLQVRDRGTFRVWTPSEEKPGDLLKEKRAQGLESAKIVLLLITDSFLDSVELLEESDAAFKSRISKGKIVVPVLLTDRDLSGFQFSNLIPIKPANGESDPSSKTANEIYRALEDLVRARITHLSEPSLTYSASPPITDGLQLTSILLSFAMLSLWAVIGLLLWFSRDPAGHNINPPKSPSPISFFSFSIVIGIAAMSLIQIARRLFRIRGAFHKARVLEWLGENALIQLYREVGAIRIKDLFDLPSELLTGQLAAIAEKIIEQQSKSDAEPLLIVRMAATAEKPEVVSLETTVESQVSSMLAIQRNLDQFQISTSSRWRRSLLLGSVLLSMMIFVIGLPFLQTASFMSGLINPVGGAVLHHSAWAWNFAILFAAALLTGLFAGFLGSIARDLVAIIEKLRR